MGHGKVVLSYEMYMIIGSIWRGPGSDRCLDGGFEMLMLKI